VIRIIPTGAMVALTSLPPLDLVIQSEAQSAAHPYWSLGCCSYLHPSQGHSSILMQLQRSDPVLKMGVEVMRPALNLEPKYRVTMLTREEWTRGPRMPPIFKGLFWFTDWSRTMEGPGAGVSGQSMERRLSVSLGNHATVFLAEVYAIFACVYELQMNVRAEKYATLRCDGQAALKALQAAKTTSPLVQQCQTMLHDIYTLQTAGMYWVPGHPEVQENEITYKLAKDGSAQKFIGP